MKIESLIEKNFYVFPVKDKMPLVRWTEESTIDPDKIAEWVDLPGRTGWGIDCGRSGLSVIDVDSGKYNEAVGNLRSAEDQYEKLPLTFEVRTRSGGFHLYFEGQIKNTASQLGKGLDTRGRGGYVVAPGSPGYEVVKDVPVARLPEWVAQVVGIPAEKKESPIPVSVVIDSPAAIHLASEYLAHAEPAIEGLGGDAHTFRTACRVRDYGISEAKALELMQEWNDACSPPWSQDDLERKVANAYQYAQDQLGHANPESVFDPVPQLDGQRYHLLSTYDIDARYKPLSWLVKGLIPARGICQAYGPHSSGKSFLMIDMLAAVAEGRPWFEYKVRQTSTVYLCLEGDAGMKQRKDAWEKHNKRRLPMNFHMITEPWAITSKSDLQDLAAILPKHSLLVIDTQNAASPGVNESASEDMSRVIMGAKYLSVAIQGCVILISHTGKDASRGVRGHSSQLAAMDSAIELTRDATSRQWKSVKVKDGVEGQKARFDLQMVQLDYTDQDGEWVKSCVISRGVFKEVDSEKPMTDSQAALWRAVKMACSSSTSGGVGWAELHKAYSAEMGKPVSETKSLFNKALTYLVGEKLLRKDEEAKLYYMSVLTPFPEEESEAVCD